MSKTGESTEKSMGKVLRFINNYSTDWIEKAFAGDNHLINHIKSKWNSLAKSQDSSYEAIVKLMTSMDAENENKLMKYIDDTFEKGGKTGSKKSSGREMELKAVKHSGGAKEGYSVLVEDKGRDFSAWVDVYISGDDVSADWNKYIFNLKDAKDVKQKAFQESADNFDMATSEATDYLEKKDLIHQDEKGLWHYGKPSGGLTAKEQKDKKNWEVFNKLGINNFENKKSSGGSMSKGGEVEISGVKGEMVKGDTIDYHKLKHVEVGNAGYPSPLGGDYFVEGKYGYAQSGYGWFKFKISDLSKMAKGGKAEEKAKSYLLKSVSADVVEDSYEEGEIGDSVHSWDYKIGTTHNSKEDLIKAMNEATYVDYKEGDFDWETGEGKSIQTDVTVSLDSQGNYYPADKKELAEWKKGKKKLYTAHYWFYVTPMFVADEYGKGGVIDKIFSSSKDGINWLITG